MKNIGGILEISQQVRFMSRNMYTLRRLPLLIVLLCISLVGSSNSIARGIPHREVTADANDFALREALASGNLEEFDRYLSLGADPTEWLDDSQYGWVFCAATETGREEFLGLLIERSYDVNFHQVDIGSAISLPLACAVRFDNLRALELLVEAGADPSIAPSSLIPAQVPKSVMSSATIVGKYDLAVWLFDKANYSDEQLKSDISMLEKFPVDESAPGNVYRLMLADKLREKGYEVNPWTRNQASDK